MNIGTLVGQIILEDELTSGLDKAASSLDSAQRRLDRIGSRLVSAGTTMTAAFTVPIVGFGVAASKSFAEFESGMNKVRAVTTSTESEMAMLTAQAQKLGAETRYTAIESAKAMGIMGQAGFDATQIYQAMPGVLQLAAAANMDVAESADIATNVLYGYRIEAKNLTQVNDVLTKVSVSTNAELDNLGVGFKYAGPVARSAGVAFEETAAALGLLGNAGIKGSMAGTSLRGAITRLLAPTKKTAEILSELGIKATDSAGKLLPLDQIVQQLEPHAENAGAMMEIFGQRAGPAMLSLVSMGSEALRSLTDELRDAGGTAEHIEKVRMRGLLGAWILLESATEGLVIAIGGLLAPALEVIMGSLTSLAQFLQNVVVPAFGALPAPIQMVVGLALTLTAVLGPLLIALGMFVKIVGYATVALNGLGVTTIVTNSLTVMNGVLFTLGNTTTVLTTRLWLMNASEQANIVTSRGLTAAKVAMTGVLTTLNGTWIVQAARLYAANAAEITMTLTTRGLTIAKTALTGVINLLNASVLVTGIRMAATSAAMTATSVAARAATLGVGLFANGLKLLWAAAGPVAVALAAIWAAWQIGNIESVKNKIAEWTLRLQGMSAEAAKAAVAATSQAEAQKKLADSTEGVNDKILALKNRISGAGLRADMEDLTRVTNELQKAGQLAAPTLRRIAREALVMKEEGIQLSPVLAKIVEDFEKANAVVQPTTAAVRSMKDELSQTRAVIASFTAEQKANIVAGKELGKSNDEIAAALNLMKPAVEVTEAAVRIYTESLKDNTKALEANEKEQDKLKKFIEDTNNSIVKQSSSWEDFTKKIEETTARMAKAIIENNQKTFDFQEQLQRMREQRLLSHFDFEKNEILRWARDQKAALDTAHADWKKHGEMIDQIATEKLAKLALEADGVKEYLWGMINVLPTGMPGFSMAVDKMRQLLGLVKKDGKDVEDALKKALDFGKSLGSTIVRAFTNGGGGARIGGAIGSFLGNEAGSKLGETLAGSLAKNISGKMGKVLGGLVGGVMGPLGSLAGGALGSMFGKLFGGGEGKKVNDMRDKFVAAAGGIDELNKRAVAAGMSLDELLKAKKVADFEAAVKKLEEGIGAYEQAEKARLESLNSSLGETMQKYISMGGDLKGVFGSAIEELIKMGRISGENAALFGSMTDGAKLDWESMQATAEKFGINIESLGPQFQQAKIGSTAAEIINAFDELTRGGADVGAVLHGMRDEISKVVEDSLKFGTEIPENMRPWIEELARTGQLTTASGDKITDLQNLKFGEPIATEFEQITSALQELIETLRGPLIDAINRIPRDVNIDIEGNINIPGYNGDDPENDRRRHMATGGVVTGPTRALIGEAGPEAVIPLNKLDRYTGGNQDNTDLIRRLDELNRNFQNYAAQQPRLVALAVRDARNGAL